jgi:hypothetical protein
MQAQPNVEIIRLRKEGEFYDVQLAIDGVLSIPQEIHASVKAEQFPTEESWMAYLIRSAQTLIETFGDARLNRIIDPESVAA